MIEFLCRRICWAWEMDRVMMGMVRRCRRVDDCSGDGGVESGMYIDEIAASIASQ